MGMGYSQELIPKAVPWVGIWYIRWCLNYLTFRGKSYSRGRNLIFISCLGIGNLTLASQKMSNSLGSIHPPPSPTLGLINIDRCIVWDKWAPYKATFSELIYAVLTIKRFFHVHPKINLSCT